MDSDEFLKFRKTLHKTQQEIAEILGVSVKAVHSYEQGWRNVPTHGRLLIVDAIFKPQPLNRCSPLVFECKFVCYLFVLDHIMNKVFHDIAGTVLDTPCLLLLPLIDLPVLALHLENAVGKKSVRIDPILDIPLVALNEPGRADLYPRF